MTDPFNKGAPWQNRRVRVTFFCSATLFSCYYVIILPNSNGLALASGTDSGTTMEGISGRRELAVGKQHTQGGNAMPENPFGEGQPNIYPTPGGGEPEPGEGEDGQPQLGEGNQLAGDGRAEGQQGPGAEPEEPQLNDGSSEGQVSTPTPDGLADAAGAGGGGSPGEGPIGE